jgi:5-methylcytosine-specific restriction protein B
VRDILAEILRIGEVGLSADDFDRLKASLPGIGPAFLSELLALRFPDRYSPFNSQILEFLHGQGVDLKAEIPHGRKGSDGERYMAASRHLADVRRALSNEVGQTVDNLLTDRFLYWVNRQKRPDPWMERIQRWKRELMPKERMEARLDGEMQAKRLLESKLGRFSEDDLREFLRQVNADWHDGSPNDRRFMPALYGPSVNLMAESLEAFNRWVPRIWKAAAGELDAALDDFWAQHEVKGGGVTLPSALLYVRDPAEYSIWLEIMSKGLSVVTGFAPGAWRTAEGYRHFNSAVRKFAERYALTPQELDVILWKIQRESSLEVSTVDEQAFSGFTDDAFTFLSELEENNNADWFEANKERYARVLREPLRGLFEAVAPTADSMLETQAVFGKVLAGPRKRWPDEEGPYHTYLWGAFYRQGYTKQTDSQLFVIVHPDHVSAGVSVAGAQAKEAVARFRGNLRQEPQLFLQLLGALPDDIQTAISERHGLPEKTDVKIRDEKDLEPLFEAGLVDIERRFSEDDPLLRQPQFADEVAELFRQLHPLYLFMTADDPEVLETLKMTGEEATEDMEDEPLYSLERLCHDTFLDDAYWGDVEALIRDKKQIIFYGPPGTGKTWVAQRFAEYWVQAASDPRGEVQVVQFHPSYAYEEFIEGIRPETVEAPDNRRELSYPVRKGAFLRFAEMARARPERRYAMVLDEVNRGELPRILGELLYLLEYRRGSVVLPYSGEKFAIPANVYLLGTMNTADRSIALVDQALRRRFHFVPMRPSPEILSAFLEDKNPEMSWVAQLLDLVNRQLEDDGIEWHRHIGHSHFMQEGLDYARLHLIWKHTIMPSLEEYFYRQPERLQDYGLEVLTAELGTW